MSEKTESAKSSKKYMSRETAIKRIGDAALKVFAQRGYHGASIRSIAEECGLSKGLIYHYFPSKTDIFLHLNGIAFEKSRVIMEKVMAMNISAWEKIESISRSIVDEVLTLEYAPYFLISLQSAIETADSPKISAFITARTTHYRHFETIIKEAQNDGDVVPGDADLLSATFLSLIQGLALMMYHSPDLAEKVTPDSLTNLLRKKTD